MVVNNPDDTDVNMGNQYYESVHLTLPQYISMIESGAKQMYGCWPTNWPGSPFSPSYSPCPSPNFQTPLTPQQHQQHQQPQQPPQPQQPQQPQQQQFEFIDQTPVVNFENYVKNHSAEKTIDQDSKRMGQQLRRDKRWFIKNKVASRLESMLMKILNSIIINSFIFYLGLEQQLLEKQMVCDSLRNTLKQKDEELETLKQHFQQLMSQRTQQAPTGFLPNNVQFVQSPHPLCTTNRNYILVPSPNPTNGSNRKPFMEKIDYSKIQLRKTEHLDGLYYVYNCHYILF